MIDKKHSGFTLVELIGVLVITGILAAVAVPRFFDKNSFDARAFSDQTQSMLRYAQKLAIAQNRNVFVRLNGTSVAICFTAFTANADCTTPNQVVPPSGSNSGGFATDLACGGSANRRWFCEAPSANVAYSTSPTTALFYFSQLGKPFNSSDNTDLPKLHITITGDGANHDIYVEQETGYVHP